MSESQESSQNRFSLSEKIGIYIAVISLIATSIFSAYSIYQNSQNMEVSRIALEMSVEPSIDIMLPENYGQEISVQNTSTVNLTDLRAFPVCYYLWKGKDGFEIRDRQPLTPINLSLQILKPKERSVIPLESTSCAKLPKIEGSYVNALVVTFRRQADNKRFVKVEPFVMSSTDPNPGWASSIQAESGWRGEPSAFIGISGIIKETETALFGMGKP